MLRTEPIGEDAGSALRDEVACVVRFGKWREIIAEPLPEDAQLYCFTTAMMRYGAASVCGAGATRRSRIERAHFYATLENVPADRLIMNNQARVILGVATQCCTGNGISSRQLRRHLHHLRQAVVKDDARNYTEPWPWMHPPRHALGALLLAQGYVGSETGLWRRGSMGMDLGQT